jgi:hypothetical protein
VLIGDRRGDDCGPPAALGSTARSPQVLASKPVVEDGLAGRSLDNSASGQWRSAATVGNYSRDACGYDLMTQHSRRTRPALRWPLPDDAVRIVGSGREGGPRRQTSLSLGFN